MDVTTNANQSLSPPKLHTTDATVLVLQFTLQKLTSIPWAVRLSWLENTYSRALFGG